MRYLREHSANDNKRYYYKIQRYYYKILRRYLPSDHYLVEVVKKTKYKKTIERLTTLRNYAAHKSTHGKRQVLQAINQKQLRSAGSWLKSQKRFPKLVKSLNELATELEAEAPY